MSAPAGPSWETEPCPVCGAAAIWQSRRERQTHVDACWKIHLALTEADQRRTG